MKRQFFKEQLLLLGVSVIVLVVMFVILMLWPASDLKDFRIGNLSIDLAANLVEVLFALVPLVLVPVLLLLNLIKFVWTRIRDYFWAPVGVGIIPQHHFDYVIEGVDGLQQRMAEKSWPAHEARAASARTPSSVDLGNANYSFPAKDRKRIRRFVGQPRRLGPNQKLRDAMLVITGEPGAGKSVIGQEIHASLAAGIRERHHALIPLIIFASDLTAEMLGVDSEQGPRLPQLLIEYFRNFRTSRYDRLADFIDTNWRNFDFVVIIDGLDEISQRSAYEKIQWRLRHIIEAELGQERKRSRKFILSCRIDDNIGVFGEAASVVLHGLRTEKERAAFCSNLIRTHDLDAVQKKAIAIALSKNSTSLASVDIFRRNPYFLSLLLEYYKSSRSEAIDRPIDFDFLINKYIAREVERAHAHAVGEAGAGQVDRLELRRSLERCASIFLQFLAYHMTSLEQEDALYGQGPISAELVEGFVAAALAPDAEGMSGVWPGTAAYLRRLAERRPLDDAELNAQLAIGHLHENDLRIFNELSLTEESGEKAIMQAFSVIALEGRLETVDWYRNLASHLAAASGDRLEQPAARMAVLLMARGLVAAHVLRLIYIEDGPDAPTVRFRHRRLAEYYAAAYFRDRWDTLQPLDDSPWITPVLNLVAAIEGERCYALAWFVERLDTNAYKPVFARRADVTSAAEAAAFAHRGPAFGVLVGKLVRGLLGLLGNARIGKGRWGPRSSATRRDFVTERTIINAIHFIAGLNIGRVRPPAGDGYAGFYAREAREPPHLLLHSGRIANSISSLAGRRRPWRFRLSSIWKALRDPNVIIGAPREAAENGLRLEWVVALLYVLLVELALAAAIGWGGYRLYEYAVAPGPAATGQQLPMTVACAFAGIWVIWRILIWRRSPSRAALLARIPLGVVFYTILAAGALILLSIWAIIKAPGVIREGWRALRALSLRSVGRHLLSLLRRFATFFLPATATVLGVLGAAALLVMVTGPTEDSGEDDLIDPLPPAVAARIHCPASATLLQYSPPAGPLDSVLAEGRREVARRYQAVVAEWEVTRCPRKYPRSDRTRSSPTDLLDALLDEYPQFIPDPNGQPPTFTRDNLEALRTAARDPVVAVHGEGPLPVFSLLMEASTLNSQMRTYKRLANEMWRARAEGRISTLDEGYPSGRAYSAMAEEVDRIHQAYSERMTSFQASYDALWGQATRAILWWCLILPAGLLSGAVAIHLWGHNKDNRRLRQLEGRSVKEICSALASQPFSDRLRAQLKQTLLNREHISQHDIQLIDDLVQKLSDRAWPRDQRFGVDLAAIVPELSNRLARR